MFYKIIEEIDPTIIGVKEGRQSQTMTEEYNYHSSNSVWKIGEKFFSYEKIHLIDFNYILLRKKAKLTDLIWSMSINSLSVLICNMEFYSFIKRFNLPSFKKVDLILKKGKSSDLILDYNIFTVTNDQYPDICYKKSCFLSNGVNDRETYKKIAVTNTPELLEKLNNRTWRINIIFELITFNKKFNLDFFRFSHLGGYYVSERLKEAIEREGFTGMRFEEAKNIVVDKA